MLSSKYRCKHFLKKCVLFLSLGFYFIDGLSEASDADTKSPCEESLQALSPLCSPDGDIGEKCSSARSMLIRYYGILWNTKASCCRQLILTFCSVINGVGEMSLKSKDHSLENEAGFKTTPSEKPCLNCPYLLLDLRDREEYDCCHIISGMVSYVRPIKWLLFIIKIPFYDKCHCLTQLKVSPQSCCFEQWIPSQKKYWNMYPEQKTVSWNFFSISLT